MDAHVGDKPDEPGRPRGQDSTLTRFTVRDASGVDWLVEATWAWVKGQPGAVHLVLHAEGEAAVSSTLVRTVEQELRRHAPDAATTWSRGPMALSGAEPEPGEDFTNVKSLPEHGDEEAPKRMGRPRDDAAWQRRRVAVMAAWRGRRPLLAALEALEPGLSQHTYRSRLRTLYRWDSEHGGWLSEVGRDLRENKGDKS